MAQQLDAPTTTSIGGSNQDEWHALNVSRGELNLHVTLQCGQSFRWKEIASDEWIGVIRDYVVTLKQTDDIIYYKLYPVLSEAECESILKDYFQLTHKLIPLYLEWGQPEHTLNQQFKNSASWLKGVRLMRQDTVECLYSFICSSNNNIGRITKMIDNLCENYGKQIGVIRGKKYYAFPTLNQLSAASESALRDAVIIGCCFGYRAKYIVQTTSQLLEKPTGWLDTLRTVNKDEAQKNLTSLMGVGPKVADCVCLFSMDKLDVVPVDTHIWTVAQKHMPSLKGKSLTTALYKDIGDFFRKRFGKYAGWAHTVLFAAELSAFQHLLTTPAKVVRKAEQVEVSTKPSNKRKRTKSGR